MEETGDMQTVTEMEVTQLQPDCPEIAVGTGGFRLWIRPLLGEPFFVLAPPGARIAELKNEIARHWKAFNPRLHRVLFRGQELLEHKTVGGVGLFEGDVLELPMW